MSIVISNPTVVEFYRAHPALNPEEVNLWLVSALEKMAGSGDQGAAQTMIAKMETFFGDHGKRVDALSSEIATQNATRDFLQTSVQHISGAMGTMRDDFKSLIVSQFVDSQKDNERMIRVALEGAVEDGKQKELIVAAMNDTIGTRLGAMVKDIQTINTDLVSASERRLGDALVRIHQNGVDTKAIATKTCGDMEGYLAKYSRSKDKGNIGERKLEGLINTLYPSCELLDTTFAGGGKGDFIMRRPGKPQIMFETKEYADGSKVPKKDVVKFLNDVKDNECCGIMVNHTGAITDKGNFHFEFHMGKVLLYIHHANYDLDKIDLAIRLIDCMDDRVCDLNHMSGGGNIMTDEVMDQINTEFIGFIEHRDRVLSDAREFYTNTKRHLEAMQFTGLHRFLSTKFATENSLSYYCASCDQGFKNNRALAAHKKGKSCKGGAEKG